MSYTLLHKGLMGTKLGMTQLFEENGDAVPCTLVEAGPCVVTQVKRAEGPDRYEAVQIGFGARREKTMTKPVLGHFKKAKVEPRRFLREVRMAPGASGEAKVGDAIDVSVFAVGDYVDVIGTMKESHGAHYFWRHAGSIGCRKPQHTRKGTKMAGQYGNTRITVQNLRVVRVELERNMLWIHGAIPGPNGGLVMVRAAKKKKAKAKGAA